MALVAVDRRIGVEGHHREAQAGDGAGKRAGPFGAAAPVHHQAPGREVHAGVEHVRLAMQRLLDAPHAAAAMGALDQQVDRGAAVGTDAGIIGKDGVVLCRGAAAATAGERVRGAQGGIAHGVSTMRVSLAKTSSSRLA